MSIHWLQTVAHGKININLLLLKSLIKQFFIRACVWLRFLTLELRNYFKVWSVTMLWISFYTLKCQYYTIYFKLYWMRPWLIKSVVYLLLTNTLYAHVQVFQVLYFSQWCYIPESCKCVTELWYFLVSHLYCIYIVNAMQCLLPWNNCMQENGFPIYFLLLFTDYWNTYPMKE